MPAMGIIKLREKGGGNGKNNRFPCSCRDHNVRWVTVTVTNSTIYGLYSYRKIYHFGLFPPLSFSLVYFHGHVHIESTPKVVCSILQSTNLVSIYISCSRKITCLSPACHMRTCSLGNILMRQSNSLNNNTV